MRQAATESAWSGLVRAALLGTDRGDAGSAGTAATGDRRLQAIVGGLANRTAESRLLGAAAALAQYRRVGELPAVTTEPAPPVAAPETLPACPPAAASQLHLMLAGVHREALAEWLGRLVARGYVVAPEDLPALLDAWRFQALPRDLIVAAAGERGRWLAALNPAWRYAVSLPDEDAAWETGPTEARVALLRRLRATSPAAALERLRSTWATEASQQRALFVQALAIGLGMADEAFLEDALDDRRKEVRAVAADLLTRLPGSRLAGRMLARVEPLVRIPPEGGGMVARMLGRTRVEVELPAACDAAMVRDGIEPKPPRGMGERAWWLAQLVAAVAPSLWSRGARLAPEQIMAAAERTEWRELLLRAWATGAARTADAEWAEALLGRWAAGERGLEPGPLAAALPQERLEAVIMRLVDAAEGDVSAAEPGLALAAEARHAWSPELTRHVLRRLAHLPATTDYAVRALLSAIALRMHPATAVAGLGDAARGEHVRGAWVDLLHHRHTMLEALEK